MAQSNVNIPAIIGGLVIITAVVLGVTGFKIPPATDSRPVANSNNQNFSAGPQIPSTNSNQMAYKFPGQLSAEQIDNKQVRLLTSKGEIIFNLDSAQAPLAVSNFVYLAGLGYFNGLTWHRVVPGFVIQGGDPLGNGTGGPGYQFPDEAVSGEYVAGTVAMANAGPNTNGSQFFIVLEDQPSLPKSYTIFGRVTSGMEVVKAIVQGDTMETVTIEPSS